MKNVFNFLIAFLFFQIGFSQTLVEKEIVYNEDNNIYNSLEIDIKPEYPGGISEFRKFIASNFITPENEKFKGGNVSVSFVIEKDGTLTNIKILKDAGFNTGTETIRVLKLCKIWMPGEKKGQNVRVLYVVPITLWSN
ncbi:energy transducer TonB [Flavobacterium sp.]|uniref:energy transducer TonB n=1 Tax=Flavobacterium sp. TaxID=239 RepID=UPI0037502866